MPFRYATHNYYLGVWFDLGIICLALIVLILARSVINAMHAVPAANQEAGTQLLAFVFGIMSVAVAIFFVDMWRPWAYIWLYVGAILRISLFVLEPAPVQAPAQPSAPLIGAPLPAFHRIATTTRR
jgi:O-antigen ligase